MQRFTFAHAFAITAVWLVVGVIIVWGIHEFRTILTTDIVAWFVVLMGVGALIGGARSATRMIISTTRPHTPTQGRGGG